MQPPESQSLSRVIAPWERSLLEVCTLYLVGGTVRDMILGRSEDSLDEDYVAAGIPLDELVNRLGRFGKLNLVGKSFGVIKFTPEGGRTVDISLPRLESSTGTGHRDFNVCFDPSLPIEKDLERRDFTINSMALNLGTLAVVDPLGGRSDLERGILRVNRAGSFVEDPLRILRGVQLVTRFDLTVEEGTVALMRRDARLLPTVSPERVQLELDKLMLLAVLPSRGFVFMHEAGILGEILPELDATYGEIQNEYHPDDVFMHSLKSCDLVAPKLHLRWAALLHDVGKKDRKTVIDGRVVFYRHEEDSERIACSTLNRLRYPSEFTRKVASLIRHHMFNMTDSWSDAAVRRLIVRVGRENIDDLLALREADGLSRGDRSVIERNAAIRGRIAEIINSDAAFKIADLAVDGTDVMEILGLDTGPEVGAVLRRLFDAVVEKPELNTREQLRVMIREGARKK
jgi:tRNA nucleotidyltransferase (CCA-adding enzyme)